MTSLSTVVLSTKGEARKANLSLAQDGTLTIESIQKYLKKKEQPEQLCYYEHENKLIYLFGYSKGKKGTENKTELPEPHSAITLFGDALLVVSISAQWEQPVPFTTDQWNNFYQDAGEEEEEEEEEAEAEEVLSEDDATSVKDDFEESDTEKDLLPDKDEEVEEDVPVVTKRRRAPVYVKVDTSALKEEISIDYTIDQIGNMVGVQAIEKDKISELVKDKSIKFTESSIIIANIDDFENKIGIMRNRLNKLIKEMLI